MGKHQLSRGARGFTGKVVGGQAWGCSCAGWFTITANFAAAARAHNAHKAAAARADRVAAG